MAAQTKRYSNESDESFKERQLSSLFTIISNNLLVATEVLSGDYKNTSVKKLEQLSKKAKDLSKELVSSSKTSLRDEISERISTLKHRMLELITDLTDELGSLDISKKSDKKAIENIILARRLLRESQRGLITIQD
jgi:archaellum component FlaC